MRVLVPSVLALAALAGCRDTAAEDRFAALEAELAQQQADAVAEREALQAEIDALEARLDGFDPTEGAAIASDLADLETVVAEQTSGLTDRLAALESGQTTQDERLDAVETDQSAHGERLTALETEAAATSVSLAGVQADIETNYVTLGAIDGVLRVTDLQPDYEDLPTLVADLTDARARLDEVESTGVTTEELDAVSVALDDAETALGEMQQQLDATTTVTTDLDTRLTAQQDAALALDASLQDLSNYVGINVSEIESLGIQLGIEAEARADGDRLIMDEFGQLNDTVNGMAGALEFAGDDIVALQSGLAATSAELGTVQGDLSTAQSDILMLQSGLSTVEGDLVTVQSDLSTAQGDVLALQGGLSTLEADLAGLEALVSASGGDITTLQSALDALDGRVGGVETDVAAIQADYLTSADFAALSDEIGDVGGFVPLDTPTRLRFSCTSSTNVTNVATTGVPSDASAIVANIYTFHGGRNDHVNHHFGRTVAPSTTWDNTPYDTHSRIADVSVTHQGNNAGSYYYGAGFGTSVIPLKANGTFDASLCRGYSSSTHYVVLQVNGYYR